MNIIPWRSVKRWNCVECGKCCKDYHVVLNFNEWANIVKTHGLDTTVFSVNKLLLGKKNDGTCCFLTSNGDSYYCGLQYMKPLACKIWPFKIFDHPKFGNPNEALYRYRNRGFFIYVDSACTGVSWGRPMPEFKNNILPEFVDVAVGLCRRQFHSTSKIHQVTPLVFRWRPII